MGVREVVARRVDTDLTEMRQTEQRNPAITVLMSVYNGERWLDEAIKSVLNQTFSDLEFIIVNDGSTDQSLEIINKFAAADPRIVVINKPNSGLADSLNCGLAKARGNWIARLDADDVCESERLERQYKIGMSSPDIVLVGSSSQQIDEHGSLTTAHRYPARHNKLYRHLISGRFFAHSSAFFRKNKVTSLGGYNPSFFRAQDYDLWLRLLDAGRFVCVNEPLIRFRVHHNMISNYKNTLPSVLFRWVALTLFQLRKLGYGHLIECNNVNFNALTKFVETELSRNNVFAFENFRRMFKQLILCQSGRIELAKTRLKTGLKNPHFFVWLMNKYLFSEYLSRKIARNFVMASRTTDGLAKNVSTVNDHAEFMDYL